MNILQDVCSDDSMQVSLHVVEHKVNISVVLCSDYVEQPNDILMPR